MDALKLTSLSIPLAIDYKKAAEEGYDDYLEKLTEYMEEELSPYYVEEGDPTKVAICFKYKDIKVDLLLSPYWKTMDSYLEDVRQIHPPLKRLL